VAGDGRVTAAKPVMGSEDFSYYLRKVPGAFIFLGSNNAERGLVHPHHSPRFDFDEACLPIGGELLSTLAMRYLEERPASSRTSGEH
jgi:metal-dependent amidase/aminoacylase/carboxypeptidase family protein